MKKCSICGNEKDEKEFYLKRSKPRARCKECSIRQIIALQQTKRKIINSYKTKCKICGYNKYKCALQFHHKEGDKLYEPTRLVSYSLDKIQKELSKCDVLCANCHVALHNKKF